MATSVMTAMRRSLVDSYLNDHPSSALCMSPSSGHRRTVLTEDEMRIQYAIQPNMRMIGALPNAGGQHRTRVYICQQAHPPYELRVIKLVDLVEDPDSSMLVRNEFDITNHLHSPHIIRAYNFFELVDKESLRYCVPFSHALALELEYCPYGDLIDFAKSDVWRSERSESAIRFLFHQIVRAVESAHHFRCAHQDVKLDNVLILNASTLKLADFGLAFRQKPDEGPVTLGRAGTVQYCSPELMTRTRLAPGSVDHGHNPFHADAWALGVLLYALCMGKLPFVPELFAEEVRDPARINEIMIRFHIALDAMEYKHLPECFSPALRDLLHNGLLVHDPLQRLLPASILRHAFFEGELDGSALKMYVDRRGPSEFPLRHRVWMK